jgi:hypothetical protein
MGDRCCTLSASTSYIPVGAWEWYADSAAGTVLATRKDRSTMTSVDPRRVGQSKVRRWTVAVRPLPLRSAARDSAAAGSSSCLWKFVLRRHRLATSWTLSRRSRTGLTARPART